VAVAFCRVEADGLLLRECVYDDEAARDALIAGIAAHYGRTEVDVIRLAATEGDYFGMARIIDVQGMLAAYAALHPEADCVICVTDPLLIENDGCYRLAEGQCERLQTSVPEAQQHTIATLTDLLVAQEDLLMTLMMND
jgi:predicted acetyltransferase